MADSISAELTARALIAPGVAELVFAMRSPPQLAFKAGQFVSLGANNPEQNAAAGAAPPGQNVVPRGSYSIASQSDVGDSFRLITRVVPEGRSSAFLMTLPLGTLVHMTGPHGLFVLDAEHPGDVVVGVTGTGIAPVMPMLGELARRKSRPQRRCSVLWGLRQEADLFAREEIDALVARSGAHLEIYLTAPGPSWTGKRGRITSALLDRLPDLTSPTFYLIGHGAMVTEIKRELISRGVDRKAQIRTEAFFD
jgi:CDP-4-dehydro-6-deoxyglucose reductase